MDAAGEVVSVTVTEPRFTPREKAMLLASRRDADAPRGRHGLLLSVATDRANKGKFTTEPTTDFAQEQLNADQKAWRDKHGDAMDVDALLWRVELTEPSE